MHPPLDAAAAPANVYASNNGIQRLLGRRPSSDFAATRAILINAGFSARLARGKISNPLLVDVSIGLKERRFDIPLL
jgi:hypothetical protein